MPNCPIKNEKLWARVKGLSGSDEEVRKLKAYHREGKIDDHDYFIIRATWTRNRKNRERQGELFEAALAEFSPTREGPDLHA